MSGSLLNLFSVIGFAVCMILGSDMGSYLVCIVIALSFVLITSSLCAESKEESIDLSWLLRSCLFRNICSNCTVGIFQTDYGGKVGRV